MPRKKIADPSKRVCLVTVRLAIRERIKLGAKLEGLTEAAAIEEAILLWLRQYRRACLEGTIEDVRKDLKALQVKRQAADRYDSETFVLLKKDPRVEPKLIEMLGGETC